MVDMPTVTDFKFGEDTYMRQRSQTLSKARLLHQAIDNVTLPAKHQFLWWHNQHSTNYNMNSSQQWTHLHIDTHANHRQLRTLIVSSCHIQALSSSQQQWLAIPKFPSVCFERLPLLIIVWWLLLKFCFSVARMKCLFSPRLSQHWASSISNWYIIHIESSFYGWWWYKN
jgi:hypothetical protein